MKSFVCLAIVIALYAAFDPDHLEGDAIPLIYGAGIMAFITWLNS